MGKDYGGWARVSDIARRLGITRGSVSLSLRTLKDRNLVVTDEHRMVKLSQDGQQIADAVLAKRVAMRAFLCEVLGLSPEQADVDSCKIEHLVSPQATERLVCFMKFLISENPAARGVLEQFRQFESDCPSSGSCALCQKRCLLARLAATKGGTPNG